MTSILYFDEKSKETRKFPNTDQGIKDLAIFLLKKYYIPWKMKHNQRWGIESFSWFFMDRSLKDGLAFLKNDTDFFHFKLSLVDSEEDFQMKNIRQMDIEKIKA